MIDRTHEAPRRFYRAWASVGLHREHPRGFADVRGRRRRSLVFPPSLNVHGRVYNGVNIFAHGVDLIGTRVPVHVDICLFSSNTLTYFFIPSRSICAHICLPVTKSRLMSQQQDAHIEAGIISLPPRFRLPRGGSYSAALGDVLLYHIVRSPSAKICSGADDLIESNG